jgi:hypothetical protein
MPLVRLAAYAVRCDNKREKADSVMWIRACFIASGLRLEMLQQLRHILLFEGFAGDSRHPEGDRHGGRKAGTPRKIHSSGLRPACTPLAA